MPGRRSVVDHALRRRALVTSVHAGRTRSSEVRTVEVCRGRGWDRLVTSSGLGAEPAPGRAPCINRHRVATE